MERVFGTVIGVLVIGSLASAQAVRPTTTVADVSGPTDYPAGSAAIGTAAITPEFQPMTTSERARNFLLDAFGPGAILRSAAVGGITQWTGTPKEWGGGAGAYGDRVGNAFARHVIRETLEFGGAAALHEDNRYFRSTDSGVFKRSKAAVASVFLARNEKGGKQFAYSRFGAVLGSSFISRVWLPRSADTPGDAAVSFGLTMVSDIGWNLYRFPAHWDPKLRIPRGQVVAAASIVSPKY